MTRCKGLQTIANDCNFCPRKEFDDLRSFARSPSAAAPSTPSVYTMGVPGAGWSDARAYPKRLETSTHLCFHAPMPSSLLRYAIAVSTFVTVFAARAQLFSTTRLLPDSSTNQHFAFTISATNRGTSINFSVTIKPKTPEFLFDASLACFDGKGEITKDSLEYPEHPHARGEPCEYRFGVASNLLTHSQFIIRYSKQERTQKDKAVDSIWFFLRDFAPSPRKSAAGRQP